MSSVGFTPQSRDHELEQLREAFQFLNDCVGGMADAEACIDILNFGLAKDHLRAARWHASQAKKMIVSVGQSKNQKRS
jgi:hypothetical protein